jgi:hypothetical protein
MTCSDASSDVAIGLPRLTVPNRFEDYLRSRRAEQLPEPTTCTCCGGPDGRWRLSDNDGPTALAAWVVPMPITLGVRIGPLGPEHEVGRRLGPCCGTS